LDAKQALTSLQADPKSFLQKYTVRIAGHPTVSGIQQYYISPRALAANYFDINTLSIANVGAKSFMAWSVLMVYYNAVDPQALQPLIVSASGGPDIMVTGLLNGCTFCMLKVPNGVAMTHVKPMGIDAVKLHTKLTTQGRFQNHPSPFQTFGQASDYTGSEDATLVGIRQAGTWKVYAQIHTRMQSPIRRVSRILKG
jgi:hypothetical protein